MEAKKLEATLRVDAEGRLQGDAELLARMTNRTFRVSIEGPRITLSPRVRRLSEIEDVEERMKALDDFLQRIARPGPADLPDNWDSRDSIYD